MRFQDKVAIVTGAGRGIGEAYAHALAGEGAAVVVALAREHVEWVRRSLPNVAWRTATLKRLVRDLPLLEGGLDTRLEELGLATVDLEPWEDVHDPAGGELPVFEECAREIHDLLAELLPLLERAGKGGARA